MRQAYAGNAINLTVNGEARQSSATNLGALLEELEIVDNAVVAEVDGLVVRQDAFAATVLSGGEHIELIRFVGGG